ncbi:hypothetical protein RHMOL_Rhmol07G0211200 [Rhododendron molle]|uniref:Uncharacterized protein n=1 Tax=Rhododendron molle TaxID=49168 RepID=A0ACC0N305_RHOML|nr:hypothetical protein RHMOL_Rhmol07G0211200 [Rhododendron molle]
MTVTPLDFATLTGLRVRGEPIPFDSGIHRDTAALEWFLGQGPLHRGKKKSRGSLLAFRAYLDELLSSQVEWDPWSTAGPEPKYLAMSRVVTTSRVILESAFGWQWFLRDRVTRQLIGSSEFIVPGSLPSHASNTGRYTLAELQRFTVPEDLLTFLRPGATMPFIGGNTWQIHLG